MALHDYFCQVCGQVLTDVNVPCAIGAQKGAPLHCDRPMNWIPAIGRMDAYEPFQEFETFDGQNQPVVVESLRQLRAIERDSEQRYRDGEGQPLVWRRYSNDRSNHDVHALHPKWEGGEQPDPAWVKKHGASLRRGQPTDADLAYGPGVDESTPTGLDHLK